MAGKIIENLKTTSEDVKFYRNKEKVLIKSADHQALLKEMDATWDPADGESPIKVFRQEFLNKKTEEFDAGRLFRRKDGAVRVTDKSAGLNVGGMPEQRKKTLTVLMKTYDGENFVE